MEHTPLIPNGAAEQQITEDIVKKYDSEARFRQLSGWQARLVSVWLILMSLFHLYASSIGLLTTNIQRTMHLMFTMVPIFLLYPAWKRSPRHRFSSVDVLLAGASFVVNMYLVLYFDNIVERGAKVTELEYWFGILAILLVLEAGRRVLGKSLPLLAIFFLCYCFLGRYFPGSFAHRGFTLKRVVQHIYLVPEGIYGVALGVSATFVFLFILFGAFLNETGGAKFFNDLALGAAGTMPGGPAKVSIFASGLLGTINGSSIANTATTGAFTIPLMKKVGYKPHFAGAVEAAASTGGQIMPPVMGAAAFIMAEFLSVPYTTIIMAAIIPAILYYFCIFMSVHFVAKKEGLQGLSRDMLPNVKQVVIGRGHLVLPLLVIIFLLIRKYTPVFAAFWGTISVIAVSYLRRETRMSFRKLLVALEFGARSALGVAIACAVVGFVIGTSSLTGLGLAISNNLVELAGGRLFLTLVYAMIGCLVLGMGLPTTANYIVTSTIIAPALGRLGVLPIAAHMFVFYFGIMADVTPPVCLAAFTGAGIAGANPTKTGLTATKLSIAAFILPYIFVYQPQLLLENVTFFSILPILFTAIIGILSVAGATMGFVSLPATLPERLALFVGGIMLLIPDFRTDILGLVIFFVVVGLQYLRGKTQKSQIT
ncbi:MAG: TRAP transporter permease [Candidatus Vecturithrix sp.]|jgi:TRAP transporter 4TM/12TM fusion protein|nr:TRAP transporter permease [Candidatus Vecturithrix sp.]